MKDQKYFIAVLLVLLFPFSGRALSQFPDERIHGFHSSRLSGADRTSCQLSQNSKLIRTMLQTKSVPVSSWGGNGIRISVEAKLVKVEYPCADGEIVGRLKMDSRGNFKANGFHIRQRPGPIRLDDKSQRQAARFEGKISGKTMTLSVILAETGENIGTFELKRDAPVRLIRCL